MRLPNAAMMFFTIASARASSFRREVLVRVQLADRFAGTRRWCRRSRASAFGLLRRAMEHVTVEIEAFVGGP